MVEQEQSYAEFYNGDNCFNLHHQVTTIFVLVCCLCVHSWTLTLDQSLLPLYDRSVLEMPDLPSPMQSSLLRYPV